VLLSTLGWMAPRSGPSWAVQHMAWASFGMYIVVPGHIYCDDHALYGNSPWSNHPLIKAEIW